MNDDWSSRIIHKILIAQREIAFETKTFVGVTHGSSTMEVMRMLEALLLLVAPAKHAPEGKPSQEEFNKAY
jgi:hypothetical protein